MGEKKIVSLIYVGFSIVIWLLFSEVFERLATYIGVLDDSSLQGILLKIAPVVMAVISYFILWRVKSFTNYITGVVSESKKVVWSTMKETSAATIVVVIAVIIVGVALGVFDWFSSIVVGWLVGL